MTSFLATSFKSVFVSPILLFPRYMTYSRGTRKAVNFLRFEVIPIHQSNSDSSNGCRGSLLCLIMLWCLIKCIPHTTPTFKTKSSFGGMIQAIILFSLFFQFLLVQLASTCKMSQPKKTGFARGYGFSSTIPCLHELEILVFKLLAFKALLHDAMLLQLATQFYSWEM